jgi:hypothetical protein
MDNPELTIHGASRWRDSDGNRHRVDGPSAIYANGCKFWYQHDILHRDDGPAVIDADGLKEWWQHGKRHRDDGPAIEYAGGGNMARDIGMMDLLLYMQMVTSLGG